MEIHFFLTCIINQQRGWRAWNHFQRCVYLALVLLVPHSELDVRVAEAVGVHGLEATPFDQADADNASPQLSFPVHI